MVVGVLAASLVLAVPPTEKPEAPLWVPAAIVEASMPVGATQTLAPTLAASVQYSNFIDPTFTDPVLGRVKVNK